MDTPVSPQFHEWQRVRAFRKNVAAAVAVAEQLYAAGVECLVSADARFAHVLPTGYSRAELTAIKRALGVDVVRIEEDAATSVAMVLLVGHVEVRPRLWRDALNAKERAMLGGGAS